MFREKIYMKYEIDRFKNSEVIRCFFKSEKSILIVFLDNHTVEIPYTKENEEWISKIYDLLNCKRNIKFEEIRNKCKKYK